MNMSCPECASPDVTVMRRVDQTAWSPFQTFGPGDRVDYVCNEPTCGETFTAVMPEPAETTLDDAPVSYDTERETQADIQRNLK